jgi:hypothetical protein
VHRIYGKVTKASDRRLSQNLKSGAIRSLEPSFSRCRATTVMAALLSDCRKRAQTAHSRLREGRLRAAPNSGFLIRWQD